MTKYYDKFYQTPDIFGEAYPELLAFFQGRPQKGRVLDLGCGQGRNALALARLGFPAVGMDSSSVGIEQMVAVAEREGLPLTGVVGDIHGALDLSEYEYVLLDNMFHFEKEDLEKEKGFLRGIIEQIGAGSMVVVCLPDSPNKVGPLQEVISQTPNCGIAEENRFEFTFPQIGTGPYYMVVIEKS